MRNSLGKNQRRARKVVEELDRRAEQEQEPLDAKRAAAQKRAAKERVERMKAALKQLKTMEAEASASERAKLRVSESEPEARKMKQADGSFALSYNVPVTTEAQSRMIVAIGVSTASNDTAGLRAGTRTAATGAAPDRMGRGPSRNHPATAAEGRRADHGDGASCVGELQQRVCMAESV